MKRFKAVLFGLGAGMMAFQWFGSCGGFWGDLIGDALILSAVD
jgi:hypothetical protein